MHPSPPAVVEVTVPRGCAPVPPVGVRVRRRDLAAVDVVNTPASLYFDRVYRAYCRNLGARGMGRSGALLRAAADRADSAAERLLQRILRAAGITGWVAQHPVGAYFVDVTFPRCRVAVEVDGWAWHVDVERFRADRRKGNALARTGWDLLRFTWHELSDQPAAVVSEIRAAVDHAQRGRPA
jgi:very-short-patch-repair endonuclease